MTFMVVVKPEHWGSESLAVSSYCNCII